MLILRIIGYLLALAGLGYIIVDGARSIAASEIQFTLLGETWYDIDRASLNAAQAVVQRYIHPVAWDPIIQTLLGWPTFAVALVLSLILVIVGRPRRRGSRF